MTNKTKEIQDYINHMSSKSEIESIKCVAYDNSTIQTVLDHHHNIDSEIDLSDSTLNILHDYIKKQPQTKTKVKKTKSVHEFLDNDFILQIPK